MRLSLPSLIVFALIAHSSSSAEAGQRIVYPQVAVGPVQGQEFKIELRLGNRDAGEPWAGTIHLLRQADLQVMVGLSVVGANGAPETRDGSWQLNIEPEGSMLYEISSEVLQVGVLVIESEQSALENLVTSFFYQLHDGATRTITDLIAVQPSRDPALAYSAMTSQAPGFNLGVAVVAESGIDAALASGAPLPVVDVGSQILLPDGQSFAVMDALGGAEAGQKAFFPNQIMSGLPARFDSARLELTASEPVHVTLLGVGSPPLYQDVQIGAAPARIRGVTDGQTNLSSSWLLTTTPTSNTCGFPLGSAATEPVLVADCGSQFSLITWNGLWGRGVVQGRNMVFTGAESNTLDFGCAVTLVSGGAGSISPGDEEIVGQFNTTASFDPAECGDLPDCIITTDFLMNKTYEEAFACFDRAIFTDPGDADYILPFPAGSAYPLSQSYCGGLGGGHRNQLAYDFRMPIGDAVIAARAGVVRFVKADSPDDGQGSQHNNVQIEHDDGSVAFYAHLKQFSILVAVGNRVQAGQRIASAGHSGTPDVPHLHFGVYQDYPPVEGLDLPVTFRNAVGPVDCRGGLVIAETYMAR